MDPGSRPLSQHRHLWPSKGGSLADVDGIHNSVYVIDMRLCPYNQSLKAQQELRRSSSKFRHICFSMTFTYILGQHILRLTGIRVTLTRGNTYVSIRPKLLVKCND